MKIYIAGPEPNELKLLKTLLLSYYDIYPQFHLERKLLKY
jgi:hypothetical protein